MLVPVAAPDRARSGYRADIQGLRGFAIVLVVAYHLWTSGRVSGGVDVFLFISAFLMVGSYARKGTAFRLVSFLIQRFRRLVPGAAVVIAVTLFVGWIVLPPTRYGSFLAHGQASLFYYENWQMIADSVDYMAPSASQLNPFQHFWSLSVQGQVFVLLALLFVACSFVERHAGIPVRRTLAAALGLVTVVSFGYATWLVGIDPAVAYLSTWARFWEFSLAGLAALLPAFTLPDAASRALSWLGVGLLTVTGLVLGRGDFPGWAALMPLAAAALVMLGGARADDRWHASCWLTRRPALFVANRAYSLYLWHWPVYAMYAWVMTPPARLDPMGSVIVLALSLLCADLTTRLIERRFQGLLMLGRLRYALAAILTFSMIALAASMGVQALIQRDATATANLPEADRPGGRVLTPGATATPTPARRGIAPGDAAIANDWPTPWPGCVAGDPGLPPNPDSGWCHVFLPEGDVTKTVAVVGDSHAYQWLTALEPLAAEQHWRVIAHVMPACRVGSPSEGAGCPEYGAETIAWLLELHPDYVFSTGSSAQASDPEHDDWGWAAAIAPVAESGVQVVNVRDNPRWGFNMPECIQRYGSLDARCRAPRTEKLLDAWPKGGLETLPNMHYLDFSDWLCPPSPGSECLGVIGNTYVYMDTNHLSRTYVATLVDVFAEAWRTEVGV